MSDTITDPNYGQRDPAAVVPPDGEGRVVQKKRWTAEEISAMPADVYARMLSNKNFVSAIDGNELPEKD
jgi:hypothetical protein